MKKSRIFIISALMIGSVLMILKINTPWYNKPMEILNENREQLDVAVKQYIETGKTDFEGFDGVSSVHIWENTIIEFITENSGIAPSGKYYGFYYSVNGSPSAFQNMDAQLIYNEKGWYEWSGEGDNGGKTKQADGNWWIFEAHF